MSDQKSAITQSPAEGETAAQTDGGNAQTREANSSAIVLPTLSVFPVPKFGNTTWDRTDRSFEDMRRPPMRKNRGQSQESHSRALFQSSKESGTSIGSNPKPSALQDIDRREVQLQNEEAARRRILENQVAREEVEAKLEEEFGERKRQLQRERDALPQWC